MFSCHIGYDCKHTDNKYGPKFSKENKKTMLQTLLVLITFLLSANALTVSESSWEILLQEGRYTEAYDIAKRQTVSANSDFLLGVMSLGAEKFPEAQKHFTASFQSEKEMSDYAHLMRGEAYLGAGVYQKALDDFKKVSSIAKTKFLEQLSEFYQAETYLALKQWSKAESLYQRSARHLRKTKYNQQILWGLLVSQVQLKQNSQICRQAKELYMKYPSYNKIVDWGIVLSENSVNGTKINCATTFGEQGLRIQRLLWSGLEDKAFTEIQYLKSKASAKTMYEVDSLLVSYLIHIGHIDEAQTTLTAYKSQKDGDYDYLMGLGKVYSRSTQPEKGIEAYYRAYQVSLRTAQAAPALFHSAFLSYVVADYKGSSLKFAEYIKKFPSHKSYADAVWYRAWLEYLQKNYDNAETQFQQIIADKEKNRRRWGDYSRDRLDYWVAMSVMRQGKSEEAIKMFSELTHDDGIGYYSVAAFQRLKTLQNRGLAQIKNVYPVHENWWLPEAVASAAQKDREEEEDFAIEADPNEEKINAILSFEDKAKDVLSEELVIKRIPQYLGEDIKSIYFNNAEKVMKRAYSLARAGLDELAYREVQETESKRLSSEQKQWLLGAHKTVNSFNRSVILTSHFFGDQAARLGLHHGINYWQHSYPKAYDLVVSHYAKMRKIPNELMWSIMRAETIFRADAVSPVGARGLMQIMPNTGRHLASLTGDTLEMDDLMRPAVSIKFGSFYLRRLMVKFKNNIPLTAAAYNGGPHRVHSWIHYFGGLDLDEFIEHIPFSETRNYVKKVSKYHAIYNLLYHKKTDVLDILAKPIGFKMEGTVPTKETWERLPEQ
jgi:soluble lytic murein transglycosylase